MIPRGLLGEGSHPNGSLSGLGSGNILFLVLHDRLLECGGDPALECRGREHLGPWAPCHDPGLEIGSQANLKRKLCGSVLPEGHLLGGMPFALPGEGSGQRIQKNVDLLRILGLEGGEAVAEHVVQREPLGTGEAAVEILGIGDAGEREGADGIASQVKPDQVPDTSYGAEMVGLDPAFAAGAVAGLAVLEGDFLQVHQGIGKRLEASEIRGGWTGRAEGDGLAQVSQRNLNLGRQPLDETGEGALEGLLKGCTPVLLGCPLSHKESKYLTLLESYGGEVGDLPCVKKTPAGRIVLDRQLELVPHVVDVALDGLVGDLEVRGHALAVGELSFLKEFVDLQHPVHRKPGRTTVILN